ncbi:hypothetical protein BYT27DRAFT_6766062 [Phlegmacium glaucopus]|nr:hypothetical protein BYT27DRAFT_6766062 [Phlegmacium glaucopus]
MQNPRQFLNFLLVCLCLYKQLLLVRKSFCDVAHSFWQSVGEHWWAAAPPVTETLVVEAVMGNCRYIPKAQKQLIYARVVTVDSTQHTVYKGA